MPRKILNSPSIFLFPQIPKPPQSCRYVLFPHFLRNRPIQFSPLHFSLSLSTKNPPPLYRCLRDLRGPQLFTMLTIKLLFVALTAGFVAAQTNSSSGSSSSGSSDNTVYDVNNVDRTMRGAFRSSTGRRSYITRDLLILANVVQWCNDQTTNCPLLCGG